MDVKQAIKILKKIFITDEKVANFLRVSITHFNKIKNGKRKIPERTKIYIINMAKSLLG